MVGAALALAALLVVAGPGAALQSGTDEVIGRLNAIEQDLAGRSGDIASLLDELRQIRSEAEASLQAGSPEDGPRKCRLYRALCLLALHDTTASFGDRLAWLRAGSQLALDSTRETSFGWRFDEAARLELLRSQFLLAADQPGEALEVLERALARYPEARRMRVALEISRPEALRRADRLQEALDLAESTLLRLLGAPGIAPALASLESTRLQVFLQVGLLDEAARSLARCRAGLAGFEPATPRQEFELRHAETTADLQEVLLLSAQEAFERLEQRCGDLLEPAAGARLDSAQRSSIEYARCLSRARLELREGSDGRSLEELRRMVESQLLPGDDQVQALLQLAWLELEHGQNGSALDHIEIAESEISRLAQATPASNSGSANALLAWGLRARMHLRDGDGDETQRRALLRNGREPIESLWSLGGALAPRPGGLGFKGLRHRRFALRQWIALQLQETPGRPGAAQALQELARGEARVGVLERHLGLEAPTSDAVRAWLEREQATLLYYLPGPDGSCALVLHAADGGSVELDEDWLLEALALEHTTRFAASAAGDMPAVMLRREREAAGALAKALLPETLRKHLEPRVNLYVCGLETLGDVAFEALPWKDGELLGTRFAVTRIPSLTFAVARANGAAMPGEAHAQAWLCPELGESASERWPELEPLPEPSGLLDALRATFGSRLRSRTGADASAALLMSTSWEGTDALLLLGHGVQQSGRVRASGLLLAADESHDGVFGTEDAEALSGPPLVVLATCRSAVGPERYGDGSLGRLDGAWLWGGSRCVVVSAVDLTYEPTCEAVGVIFSALAQGRSVAEAVRLGRCALAASENWNAPWHVGALQVLGSGGLRWEPRTAR